MFGIYDPGVTTWSNNGGIYIFAFVNRERLWQSLYIGTTENFDDRFSYHERWAEAMRRGATHIHAMVVPHEANRQLVEEQLVQLFQPPMNDH